MGVLSKGTDFTNGDQVTDTSLDNLVDNATFTTSAVDEVSTDIGGSGSIIVKDGGITTGKLADSTSAATGVTSVKIATAAVTAAKIGTGAVTVAKLATDALELAYPVGSIYMNATDSTDPATLLGFGTWATFGAGRVLLGVGEGTDNQPTPEVKTFAAGDFGGQYKHTLLEDEMPAHTHTMNGQFQSGSATNCAVGPGSAEIETNSAGGGLAHYNIQPYIAVHMWTRTV